MLEIAKRYAVYDDLYSIPENAIGEIIEGDLYAHPRPARRHMRIASKLGFKIGAPYEEGIEGPGGWVIGFEPEIGLGGNILVPDLAGWRKERYPEEEDTNWISVAPDWICEVLSPSTADVDMIRKMPIYAEYDVGYAWIVDPAAKLLSAYRTEAGKWFPIAKYRENDRVRVEPFPEVEINLADLWIGGGKAPTH